MMKTLAQFVLLFGVANCVAAFAFAPSDMAYAQDRGSANETPDDSEIVVARLTYDNGKTAVCFADQFLTTYARETGQNVRRGYVQVALASEDLFDHPFVVFSGQEAFSLSDQEKKQLETYIERGGFVLASAGCSNGAWARSFESFVAERFGDAALKPIGTKHALFNTVYKISNIDVPRTGGRDPIQALTVGERVAILYSPLGLNDTGNAGGDCCCCGGSEIKNARLINVNALGYALTR
jgi:hypothetical protein